MNTKQPRRGLLSRLTRPLAAIGRRLSSRAEESTAPAPAAEGGFDLSLVDESFTLTLDAMLKEDQGRFQIKLHIISLVEFREAVGDKWQRLSDKVMLIAEGVIARHLGAGNVCGRQGSDFFVLLFRTVPEEEGRRRAVKIAEDLGTRLLGDQFAGHSLPLALAAELPLADAMGPDGKLDPAALAAAIAETRALIAESADGADGGRRYPPGGGRPGDDQRRTFYTLGPSADHELAQRLALLPGQGTDGPAGPEQVADPTWRAVEIRRERAARPDPVWTPMVPSGRAAPAEPPAAPPPIPADAALSVLWRPTWIAAGEVIGASLARLQRIDRPGEPVRDGSHAYAPGDEETARTLDRVVIAGGARALTATAGPTPPPGLILPLHWATVGSARRLSLLAPLFDLPEGVRSSRLILDLFGVPDGVAERDLAATIAALRPLTKRVMLRVPLDRPRAARAAECGATMIGIDLGDLPPGRHPDDDSLLDALAQVYQNAEAAGLGVYAWGIRRRTAVLGTVLGGYAMVNGPGLMKDLDQPARILPAPRSRFTAPPPKVAQRPIKAP